MEKIYYWGITLLVLGAGFSLTSQTVEDKLVDSHKCPPGYYYKKGGAIYGTYRTLATCKPMENIGSIR